jgi:putative PIN family toxin of toxin-antitoxin system
MRIVLDTNVWLDWLLFDDPGIAALRAACLAGSMEVVIDAACEAELERVLGYRFYRDVLPAEKQAACLAECRRVARRIEAIADDAAAPALPSCRDRDDQKFLELARAARADALVTKDEALLELSDRGLPFLIVKPAALRV